MAFRIQNNVAALNTNRYLNKNQGLMSQSLARLSSGYRINSASDDAAGMAASMRFRAEIESLKVASRNAAEATSLLQVAEGSCSQLDEILVRMKELATQAASGNAGVDRGKIDLEATQLEAEISRIVSYTQYNGQTLLDGSFGAVALSSTAPVGFTAANGVENIDVTNGQPGATYTVSAISYAANTITLSNGTTSQTVTYGSPAINTDQVLDFSDLGVRLTINSQFAANETNIVAGVSTFSTKALSPAKFQVGSENNASNQLGFSLPDLTLAHLSGGATADIDLTTQAGAQAAMDTISTAIDTLASARASIGVVVNRLSYTSSNLSVSIENKTASESTIRDVDMAMEMSEFSKYNILTQAGVSMLAQANNVPQQILSLLK